jgi:hypothetical protein
VSEEAAVGFERGQQDPVTGPVEQHHNAPFFDEHDGAPAELSVDVADLVVLQREDGAHDDRRAAPEFTRQLGDRRFP